MPFFFILIGLGLFASALNNSYKELGQQLYKDIFTDKPSFLQWILAIVVVGLIGYIPKAKPASDAFMLLIIIGMVIATKGGFFTEFKNAIDAGPSSNQRSDPFSVVPVIIDAGTPAGNAGGTMLASAGGLVNNATGVINTGKNLVSSVGSIGGQVSGLIGGLLG